MTSFIFTLILLIGIGIKYLAFGINLSGMWIVLISLIVAAYVSASIKIADQWDRVAVLRLGKFHGLKGPGIFFIIPLVDKITSWIDTRIISTSFKAEKTLTKDTVPVDVDTVLFWKVNDPEKAALEVVDYQTSINLAAQTALRDVIGKMELADVLKGREKIDEELLQLIDERIAAWGIHIESVEIKDILIPKSLENAMSMQAQAERERKARVILGDSERQIAEKFKEASHAYKENPVALHLRAMNMLYEGLKENATLVIVPSSAVDSMQLGSFAGTTALAMELEKTSLSSKKGSSKEKRA